MFSDPVKNVEKSGIQPGMEIADLGAGSGHYTMAAAKALLSTGRVYAIDVEKELLAKIKNNAARAGLYNVEVIWGDIEKINGTKLKEASIDLAFLCNVLFQEENKTNIIKEIKRILKPGGRVLVVDWEDSFGGIGPSAEMVVKRDEAMDLFEKNGFHLDREISAGAHHYGLIYKKL
jgi:ubiquinone/menaquinone biosynthesis C-methylase UbiE